MGHLVRFRAARLRGARARVGVVLLLAVTLAAATVPAALPGARDSDRAFEVLLLLPSGYAAFAVLALVNAISSGGGRELLPKEHGVAFPVSPTTDHLGALLLSPLTITWLLQAWFVVGATAYASPAGSLLRGEVLAFSWLLAVTAGAQGVAWATEWVRRGPAGLLLTRGIAVLLVGGAALLQITGHLVGFLDSLPTRQLVLAAVSTGAGWGRFALVVGVVLGGFLLAVVLGAFPAHLAARRTPRDEVALETLLRPARRIPESELTALLRTDRASVWRAVPVRRGMVVLAVGPGAVALAGGLPWSSVVILPGLVASGAALLFGVNAWCLDQRGALWRESLPGLASRALLARTWVLAELLLVAAGVTLTVAALRAGVPTPAEAAAVVAATLVVVAQVVSRSMRWSVHSPYAVDLRSARATPAPPLMMVAYSARLAVVTTLTGLVFSTLARVEQWPLVLLVAVPFLLFSVRRLVAVARAWQDPATRARVVATVAA